MIIVLLLSATLHAETIKIVVPFAPSGSGPDAVAKVLQELLLEKVYQTSVIDYRPGAGGLIGISSVAKDKSNSTVLLVTSSAIAVHTESDPGILKDLIPVAYIGYYPLVLVATSKFPFKNLKNWNNLPTDYLITAGVGGTGSSAHLNTVYLKNITNKNIISVQYKGAAPVLPDLIAGRTDIGMQFLSNVSQYIDNEQLIALGVLSDKRIPQLPEVPTFNELGYKNFGFKTWIAVFANPTASTSDVEKIQKMLVAVLSNKEKSKIFQSTGIIIEPTKTLNLSTITNQEISKIHQYFQKYGNLE